MQEGWEEVSTDAAAGGGPTILIADDEDDIRQLMAQLLAGEGYRVVEARDGAEAVEAAARHAPRLILMDIAMPGVDGLSAVWRIRGQPGLATVPIVIVSAYDTYDLRAEAAGAGCNGYLVKPLEVEKLKALVRELAAEGREEEARGEADFAHDTVLAHPTILTVLEQLHRLESRLTARLDRLEGEAIRLRSELKAQRGERG